jgi:hypothetical protein
MKINGRAAGILFIVAILCAGASSAQTFPDDQSMLQFQRAADSYAFAHRQNDRRGRAPSPFVEGEFFTPMVAATFRARILNGGCELPGTGDRNFVVPRVNAATDGTRPLSPCLVALLPKLPAELEYRSAGVVLVLVDAHLHIVMDVLHGAFPARDN